MPELTVAELREPHIAEFTYRVSWASRQPRPGSHRSTRAGSGGDFFGFEPFSARPDPRHIDLRASLRDPLGQWQVRSYRQPGSIAVYAIADLSASMRFGGLTGTAGTLAATVAAIAHSAHRQGDGFALLACDSSLREDLSRPLSWSRHTAVEVYRALATNTAYGRGAFDVTELPHRVGRQRALVFVVSDFLDALEHYQALFRSLSAHDVVPVVLWHRALYRDLPTWGLAHFGDPESGAKRLIWLRPTLRQAIVERFDERRAQLRALANQYGREPLFLEEGFDPDRMTEYFFQ